MSWFTKKENLELPISTLNPLDKIVAWAEKEDPIKVLMLTGSLAGRGPRDELSDYDIAVFTNNIDCDLLSSISEAKDGNFAWRIAQRVEMGRPGFLQVRTEKKDGEVNGVWIGGNCVMMSKGIIYIY